MTSKYASLPDIDTAADVFETVDEPEQPLRPNSDNAQEDDAPAKSASDGIDATGLPERRRAERAFGRARRKDGTYQLGLPPLTRTLSSSSDDTPLRAQETPAARIRRLKAELAEVEQQVASSSSAPRSVSAENEPKGIIAGRPTKRQSVLPALPPVDLVSEVSKLQERLQALDGTGNGEPSVAQAWRSRLAGTEDGADSLTVEASLETAALPTHAPLGSAELDRRLAALEKLVGTSGEGIDTTPSAPLLSSLTRYEHLLSLLSQPRHLDAVSRRIKLLLVDLDRAAAASRRAGVSIGVGGNNSAVSDTAGAAGDTRPSNVTLTSAEYMQLESLFALLPRLDGLLPIVPPLLARLQSLAALHAEAADMTERLARIEGDDKGGKDAVGEMTALLKVLQEGVGESRETVLRNWETVEGRMKALEERIGRL